MLTFCSNPIKLVAFVKPVDGKRTVLTYNLKTAQILPVALDQLEEEPKGWHELELETARLVWEAAQYHEFMKENA